MENTEIDESIFICSPREEIVTRQDTANSQPARYGYLKGIAVCSHCCKPVEVTFVQEEATFSRPEQTRSEGVVERHLDIKFSQSTEEDLDIGSDELGQIKMQDKTLLSDVYTLKKVGKRCFLQHRNGKTCLLSFKDVTFEGVLLRGDGKLFDVEEHGNGEVRCVEVVDEGDQFYLKKRKNEWVLVSKVSKNNTELSMLGRAKKVQLEGDMLIADEILYIVKHEADGKASLETVTTADIVIADDTFSANTEQDDQAAGLCFSNTPDKSFGVKHTVQAGMECVICMDKITNPEKLQCGHIFCKDCIDEHFKAGKVCPTCGTVYEKIKGETTQSSMQSPSQSLVTTSHSDEKVFTVNGLVVRVYKASICSVNVDCIVNAANEHLSHGAGVSAAIARAAGKALEKEGRDYVKAYGKIAVGQVCRTTAGNLPYKCVIHAVGPAWWDYQPHDYGQVKRCAADLYSAVFNSFIEADRQKLSSIALPAISSAIFAVPMELCIAQFTRAVYTYSCRRYRTLSEIHFVDIRQEMVKKIADGFKTAFQQNTEPSCDLNKFVIGNNPKTGQKQV